MLGQHQLDPRLVIALLPWLVTLSLMFSALSHGVMEKLPMRGSRLLVSDADRSRGEEDAGMREKGIGIREVKEGF
jgi:hypothetical protein